MCPFALNAQNLKNMEFHNQKITDILLSIAEVSDISIIPDETIEGTASFYFSDGDVENSLSIFLDTYNLYSKKENGTYRISKIKSSVDNESGLVSIKADDIKIEHLIKNLSSLIRKTILYDTLPSLSLSVDIENLSPEKVLEICIKKLPDFQLETNSDYYYLKRMAKNESSSTKNSTKKVLVRNGDYYTLSLEKGRFLDILQRLFALSEKEYSIFVQSDVQLENLYFENKDFSTILSLILEHGNADFIEKNNIFYIVDLQKKNITSKLRNTEIIHLTWIAAQDITTMMPQDLSSGSVLRIDKNSNSILLTGTKEEVEPIKRFITLIDIPLAGLEYQKIDIKYLDAKELISLIPQKMIQSTPVVIPGTNSILATGTKETLSTLSEFISKIDQQEQGVAVRLKFIQVEDLLKNLTPSVNKELIVDSGYPNIVFFKGSKEKLQIFLKELDVIDRPIPQIRYQLLVIQYTKTDKQSLTPKTSIKNSEPDMEPSFFYSGSLSNVMDLSFDIISKFGFDFAASLNSQIEENTAKIFTDTTLTALSGQDVKFQNTDTYRYMQYDYDSSSNTKSGTTQSITSGLLVGLNGWSSGDNMITMTVNATISKQNSLTTGNSKATVELPSTSERVVTTQVRSLSGEPVIISGLIKEDNAKAESQTPLLGKIPLLGHLFKQTSKAKEKTEIVIYIVPHLIKDPKGPINDALCLERYYKTLMGNDNVID